MVEYEKEVTNNYGIYRLLMIQVPIEKKTETIFITYTYPSYRYFGEWQYNNDHTQIDIKGIENYFYIDNLEYQYNKTLDYNQIFTYFLNFFFDEEKNKEESLKISLMKALINKVNQYRQIFLSPEIIFRYLKYCIKFKLKLLNINAIKIIENINNKISKDYYISNEDIDKMLIDQYEKPILIKNFSGSNLFTSFFLFSYSSSSELLLVSSHTLLQL